MSLRIPRSRRLAVVVAAAVALQLSGCSAIVPLQPAPSATDPVCADVIVHLPSTVADEPARETNAQATGAWGTPATILLHCGVDVPGLTTLPCVSVNGIDWIEDDTDAPRYRFTTYGREPAVELVIDSDRVSGSSVLVDLATAVGYTPATKSCTGVEELLIPSEGVQEAPTAPATQAPEPTQAPQAP